MSIGGRRKFLVSYMAVGISTTLFVLRPLVFAPIITRRMGQDEYGVWGMVAITAMFLGLVLPLRMVAALRRFMPGCKDDHDISRAHLFGAALVLGNSAVLFLLTQVIPRQLSQLMFGDQELTQFVLPAAAYSASTALFIMVMSYHNNTGRHVTYSIFRSLLVLGECAMILFFSRFTGLANCIYALSGWQALLCMITLCIIVTRHGWAVPSIKGFSGMWHFAGWMLLTHWLFFLSGHAGRYVLVGLLGVGVSGVYYLAFQVSSIIGLIGAPNQYVLMPMLAGHWNTDRPEQVRPLVRLSYLTLAVLGFPAIGATMQLGNYLIQILTTKDFIPSAPLLGSLCVAAFLYSYFMVFSQCFELTRKFLKLQIIIAVSGVLNISLAFLVIPHLGVLGAGIAYCVAMTFTTVCVYLCSRKVFGTGLDWIRTIKAFILGLAVYFALFPVHDLPVGIVGKLLAGAGITLVVMVAGFFALRFYSIKDLRWIFGKILARDETQPQAESSQAQEL